jgi:uncharacterized protein
LQTIVLLTVSNIFVTFAWYGHLKYRSNALWKSRASELGNCVFRVLLSSAGEPDRVVSIHGRATEDHPGSGHIVRVRSVFRRISGRETEVEYAAGFACLCLAVFFVFHNWESATTTSLGKASHIAGEVSFRPRDSFTGTWKCNLQKSKLGAPPKNWIQTITASQQDVQFREEILRAEGPVTVITVAAKFDGEAYPVEGSPVADTIAYTRDGDRIVGTAKKGGAVSLREILTVAPKEATLTKTFSVFAGGREIAAGVAVFEKEALSH